MTDEIIEAPVDDAAPGSMLALTTKIVAAYISKNATQGTQLPTLIEQVFQSLAGLATGSAAAPEARPEPAVPVKKSVFPDYIVCLEDGKKLKMLKRHLMTSYGLTPDAYRERWGLPANYPMVAPSYAERRSALAKSIGLGRKPTAVEAKADGEESTEASAEPARRGRKPARAAAAEAVE